MGSRTQRSVSRGNKETSQTGSSDSSIRALGRSRFLSLFRSCRDFALGAVQYGSRGLKLSCLPVSFYPGHDVRVLITKGQLLLLLGAVKQEMLELSVRYWRRN